MYSVLVKGDSLLQNRMFSTECTKSIIMCTNEFVYKLCQYTYLYFMYSVLVKGDSFLQTEYLVQNVPRVQLCVLTSLYNKLCQYTYLYFMYSVLIKGDSLLQNRMYIYVLWSSQRGFLIIEPSTQQKSTRSTIMCNSWLGL